MLPRLSRWLVGILLVMAAAFLGYQTSASDRDPLLSPPDGERGIEGQVLQLHI